MKTMNWLSHTSCCLITSFVLQIILQELYDTLLCRRNEYLSQNVPLKHMSFKLIRIGKVLLF